jgi:hypothetical protein
MIVVMMVYGQTTSRAVRCGYRRTRTVLMHVRSMKYGRRGCSTGAIILLQRQSMMVRMHDLRSTCTSHDRMRRLKIPVFSLLTKQDIHLTKQPTQPTKLKLSKIDCFGNGSKSANRNNEILPPRSILVPRFFCFITGRCTRSATSTQFCSENLARGGAMVDNRSNDLSKSLC